MRTSRQRTAHLLQSFLLTAALPAGAGLLALNFINLFLPFAAYALPVKALAFAGCTAGGYALLWAVRRAGHLPDGDALKHGWAWRALLAAGLTLLTLLLTQARPPLVPVDISFTVEAAGPVRFSHAILQTGIAERSYLDLNFFQFEGDWLVENGSALHQGAQTGTMRYRQQGLFSQPLRYELYFLPQDAPGEARITLDGQTVLYPIPPVGADGSPVEVRLSAAVSSVSSFYRLWLQLDRLARGLLLFAFFFLSMSALGTRAAGVGEQVVLYGLLWVSAYWVYHSLNFQDEFVHTGGHNLLLLGLAGLFFILVPLGMVALLRRVPRAEVWTLALILLLAAGLRIYWIQMVPTAQVSDFGDLHRWALQLARGEPGLTMDRHTTYARLVSLIYRLHPAADAAQGLNVMLSLLSVLGLYWLGRQCGNPQAGLLAAYCFAIFPSEIGMVTLVCTDIAAAAGLIWCAALLARFQRKPSWAWLALGGLAFGLALRIRPPLILYAPMLLTPLLPCKPSLRRTGGYALAMVLGLVGGLLAVSALIAPARVDGMRIDERRSVILPLLNGTNIAERGLYNEPDAQLTQAWTAAETWSRGAPLVLERVFSDPVGFIGILKYKYSHLLANATYGANLAFLGSDMNYNTFQTGWPYPTQDVRRGYAQFSQYAYVCVLGAALLAALGWRESQRFPAWLNLVLFVCALGAYAFFEVQPRYQRPLIPFMLLLAAWFYTRRFRSGHLR